MEKKHIVIDGVETGYTITENGEVFSPNGRQVKMTKRTFHNDLNGTQRTHRVFRVCLNGVQRQMTLHQALARAFIPNPNGFRYVAFKDGDCDNLDLGNLYWSHTFVRHELQRPTPKDSNFYAELTDVAKVLVDFIAMIDKSSNHRARNPYLTNSEVRALRHIYMEVKRNMAQSDINS